MTLLKTAAVGLMAALSLVSASAAQAQAPGAGGALVDPSVQSQPWEGWGTSLAWWAHVVGGFPEPIRTEYMDKAFDPVKGLGLNVIRYNVGGGENPAHLPPNKQFLSFRAAVPGFSPQPGVWDWSADANQRFVLKAAIQRGADQLEAFSNSPPWWATVSGSVTGGVKGADNMKPGMEDAFGDYLATVTKHFHDDWGVTFRILEPLNEPTNGWQFGGPFNGQEGCVVTPPHQNIVIKATAAALKRAGITATTVTASDETSISASLSTFNGYDPATLAAISKVNTHSYGGGNRQRLGRQVRAAGKDLWMSEYGDGDASGLSLSRQILTDINGLHPTAWVYWQVIDGGGWGMLSSPEDSFTNTAYVTNKKYYVMGQYSRYVRPGCLLLSVADPNTLAALDTKKKTLTLVVTNSGDGDAPLSLDLSRFTQLGKRAAVVRTSATEEWARPAPVALTGKTLAVTLPAKSVTTFVISGAAYTGPLSKPTPSAFAQKAYALTNGSGERLGGADGSWRLVDTGEGDYALESKASGQVLDVYGNSHDAGGQVGEYAPQGTDNQSWNLRKAGDGTYTLLNRESGLALSLSASKLTQEPDKGLPAETWRLVPE